MRNVVGLTVGLALLASATPALAADATGQERALYLKYCGACHGPHGKGDGIAGTFMRPKPIDLTQIAKQNGGEFPFERTMQVIDGRRTVRAHGDADMPVWGEVLSEQTAGSAQRRGVVNGTLTMITDYIRSIQEK
jgi:mono/diheme cytochrome c family protein